MSALLEPLLHAACARSLSIHIDRHFLLIIPACMLLLGATLIGCWLVQRRHAYLPWIAGSYALVGSGLAWQNLMAPGGMQRWALVTGVMFLLGSWCFARGMAGYYGVSARPRLALLIGAVVLVVLYYYSRVEPSLWMRMLSLNAGLGLIQLLPTARILQRRLPAVWLERAMYWSYVLCALYTSVRPLMSYAIGYRGESTAAFSSYWLLMLATTLLFAMVFATLLLANTVRDAMAALRAERNLDPLTNLLYQAKQAGRDRVHVAWPAGQALAA